MTNFDGPGSGTTYITFSLINTAGTWANVSSVLAANASGYDAAMQLPPVMAETAAAWGSCQNTLRMGMSSRNLHLHPSPEC